MTFPEFMAMFQKQNSGDWATARQTWEYLHERLPCGHLRAEWVDDSHIESESTSAGEMRTLIDEGHCARCREMQEEAEWWSAHDTAFEIDAVAKSQRLAELRGAR